MFGNFLYIIVVLLIFLTYQPVEGDLLDGIDFILFFSGMLGLFALVCATQFGRILKQVPLIPYARLDLKFSTVLTRMSIMAVVLMAVNIYGLNLPDLFARIPGVQAFPTVQGLLCIAIFLFYLAIVWYFAYDVHVVLHHGNISRAGYVYSNIAFNIPVFRTTKASNLEVMKVFG